MASGRIDSPIGQDAWEEDRIEQVAVATRAALRAVPTLGFDPDRDDSDYFWIVPDDLLNVLRGLIALVVLCRDVRLRAEVKPKGFTQFFYWEYPPLQSVYSSIKAGFDIELDESDVASALRSARQSIAQVAASNEREGQQSIEEQCQNSDTVFVRQAASKFEVFERALWQNGTEPDDLSRFKDKLYAFWRDEQQIWGFWQNWYQGLLDGSPLDWDLQRRVALISDEDWRAGPEQVAARIAEIEADLARGDLDPEQLRDQSERLSQHSRLTVLLCRMAAEEVEAAQSINCLPEEFERLRDLPPVLNLIAELARSRDRIGKLEMQVADLIGVVAVLTRDLETAGGKSRSALFKDTVMTTSAVVLTTGFWGLVGATISHVTGIVDVGDLLDRFARAVGELPLVGPDSSSQWPDPGTDI